MNGKGSLRRPMQIARKVYAAISDKVFGVHEENEYCEDHSWVDYCTPEKHDGVCLMVSPCEDYEICCTRCVYFRCN